MNKRILIISLFITLESVAIATDSVYIPCQKLKSSQGINTVSVEYDSTTGYDFTGKGKPRYYDSMYYNYYMTDPKYKLFNTYPAFIQPAGRFKGK